MVRGRPGLGGRGRGAAWAVAAGMVALAGVAGCSGAGSGSSAGPPAGGRAAGGSAQGPGATAGAGSGNGALTAAQQAAVADGATAADTDASGVEWLCRPGQSPDPCRSDLTAVVRPASGPPRVERAALPADPPIDCFYIYGTVSGQNAAVANLRIDPSETAVARTQASRFSQVCRVYAPLYPQLTLHAVFHLEDLTAANETKAYDGVEAAWDDYLARYNRGRGVVIIGHSQGAAMGITLLRRVVDDRPAVRRRLVSAVLLGGNVTVPVGRTVGGSFSHIPACTSTGTTGCVVAYSTFDQPPPPDSLFGRPGLGVSLLLYLVPGGAPGPTAGMQVLCVNPAAPGGAAADLAPYFPTAGVAGASWVTQPGLYRAQCMSENGASWLQVSAPITAGDARTVVGQTLGPAWGMHPVDVNIALGNLVDLVGRQSAAYRHAG